MKIYMIGNMPLSHLIYAYKNNKILNKKGAKVFYLKSHYIEGKPDLKKIEKKWEQLPDWAKGSEIVDYKWVNKTQISTIFENRLYQQIKDILN